MSIVPPGLSSAVRRTLAPVVRGLRRIGVTANTVTVIGFVLTVVGAALLANGQPAAALVVLLLGTLSDSIDGQLARASGGGTRFGGFLDSTLDRLSDAALAVAAIQLGASMSDPRSIYAASASAFILYWGGLVLLVAAFLVSYIRAKAESIGEGATVGFAPREARIALYLIGVAAWAATGNPQLFAAAVGVAAFLATVTVLQRIAHMASALNEKKG
ncbi:MAG: CDP-alcohol phosphatidyltransferase family protein [Chloroflexota bacterium]